MSIHQVRLISGTLIAVVLATVMPISAHAQYVWLDEKGTRQFSDMPPPSNTPKNRIIKTPYKTTEDKQTTNSGVTSDNPDANSAANKLQKPVTTATKNEDFQKRRAEQADAEKKAAEEAQNKADKAKNCERAKTYQQALDSGIRITTTDKNGEKNYMDDAQRSKEAADTKRALAGCQ